MSRIRPRRATPRQRDAPRGDSVWWTEATTALHRRSGRRCEKCGRPYDERTMERHHRQRRRDGGDRLSNLLALHPECHRYITEHPAEAMTQGWIVSAYQDPAEVPVQIAGLPASGLYLLYDDGTRATYPFP